MTPAQRLAYDLAAVAGAVACVAIVGWALWDHSRWHKQRWVDWSGPLDDSARPLGHTGPRPGQIEETNR